MEKGVICPLSAVRRPRQGIILIVVLFLILILGIVILQFGVLVKYEKTIAANRAGYLKAMYTVESKLETAKLAILKQKSPSVSRTDELTERESGTGGLTRKTAIPGVTITDASSRLNINMIVDRRGKVNDGLKVALENLLTEIDGDPGLVEIIIDFIDRDDDGKHEKGALNRPLQNITELGLIPEIQSKNLKKQADDDNPGLFDLLTVFSRGRININTAPRELLISIAVNRTYEKAVANIIERRDEEPFEKINSIYEVPGVSRGMFGDFEKSLITDPSVFIVDVTVKEGNITCRARAVFEKLSRNVRMLFFHAE